MSDTVFKPAWRKNNPALEADAIAFWRKSKFLPKGVAAEERAKELCGLVYRDGEVIAVSTITIQKIPRFRCRIAMYRCAASPSFRRSPYSLQVTNESRALMEQWSLEHPEEGVMGLAAAIESKLLERHMPSVFWPAALIFMGYMPNGQQLRVAWFKHATVNPKAPTRKHGFGQVPQQDS